VHLAIDLVRHCQVACKSIRTKKDREIDQVIKEINILMSLNHVGISVAYSMLTQSDFGVPFSPTSIAYMNPYKTTTLCMVCFNFHTAALLQSFASSHIFLQLCTGGDLFTYINSHSERSSRICEAEAKYIMYQLLKALEYMHSKSISHRGEFFFLI